MLRLLVSTKWVPLMLFQTWLVNISVLKLSYCASSLIKVIMIGFHCFCNVQICGCLFKMFEVFHTNSSKMALGSFRVNATKIPEIGCCHLLDGESLC